MAATSSTVRGQVLAMSVAGRSVAVAAAEVEQVLPMLPLWRPPTTPAPLSGFARSRDGVLPVLSLRALLGLGDQAAPGLYAHIVKVGRIGSQRAGLLVDRAEGFVVPSMLEAVAATESLNGCATALFSHSGGSGWLIDPARLLSAAEGEVLAALVKEESRRLADWTLHA